MGITKINKTRRKTMSYRLKAIAKRIALLSTAAFVAVAAYLPAPSAFADALNPLTERSLTLSSSSPGWSYTDGSGNSTYAPPNSGANGQKTGNYFDFKVSSTATVKTMSFQYCTTSAGECSIPGNDTTRGTDTSTTTDLSVTYPSAAEVASGASGFDKVISDTSDTTNPNGNVTAIPGYTNSNPKYQANGGTGDPAEAAKSVTGNFIVMRDVAGTWTQDTGWTASAQDIHDGDSTKGNSNNYIVLTKAAGLSLTSGQRVKVLFFATGTNYITNPGAGAFFVKINTYNVEYNATPTGGQVDKSGLAPVGPATNIIDGGVTVANVMNQSIQITTKVLETMQFSVGTVDPDTLTSADGTTGVQSTYEKAVDYTPVADDHKPHGTCDIIAKAMTPSDPQNVLQLGDQAAESSLSTDHTYATHSYWRLSSNSSAGATVYYSGHTLANTSGDEIKGMNPTAAVSQQGTEQFGLAISQATLAGGNVFDDATHGVNYGVDRIATPTPKYYENGADNNITGVDDSTLTDLGATLGGTPDYTGLNASFHMPRLNPLNPTTNYGGGSGKINPDGQGTGNAMFAFDTMSDTVPTPIADDSSQVVDCVTAKMRYIANIAATTPAGIYTTKINYIAAPQY